MKIFSQKQTNQIIPATIEKIKNSFITQVKKGLKWENKTSTIRYLQCSILQKLLELLLHLFLSFLHSLLLLTKVYFFTPELFNIKMYSGLGGEGGEGGEGKGHEEFWYTQAML